MAEPGILNNARPSISRSASERAKAYTPSQADREAVAKIAGDAIGTYIGSGEDDGIRIAKRRTGDGYYVDIYAVRKAYGRQHRYFYDSNDPKSRDIDEEPLSEGNDIFNKIKKRIPQVTRVIITVETD